MPGYLGTTWLRQVSLEVKKRYAEPDFVLKQPQARFGAPGAAHALVITN